MNIFTRSILTAVATVALTACGAHATASSGLSSTAAWRASTEALVGHPLTDAQWVQWSSDVRPLECAATPNYPKRGISTPVGIRELLIFNDVRYACPAMLPALERAIGRTNDLCQIPVTLLSPQQMAAMTKC